MRETDPKIVFQHLLVFILSCGVPLVLYLVKVLDNNRLTSWNWAFGHGNYLRFQAVLFCVMAAAFFLSRVSFITKGKAIALFVVAFAASSLFWSEPEVIVDAARYFTQAKYLEVYGVGYFLEQWGKEIFAWTDLPLIPFLYGLVFKIFGEHRVLIQILNSIFYSLTVVLTYQLGKDLWDEETGFLGGVLLLGFPYLYTQVPLMLVDVPTMFLLMLAVVTGFQALKTGGGGRIVTASFSLCLLFYAKYSSWMLLVVMPVIVACFLFSEPVQALRRGGLLALLSLFFIGIVFAAFKDVFVDQLVFLFEYQKPGLKRWSESYFSTFLFQVHPFITVAGLASFVVAFRKTDFRFLIVSCLLLVFLLLQVQRIRYTLPIFPMLALMAAYSIGALQNRVIKKHIIYSVAGSSFIVAFMGFLPLLKGLGVQNLQEAGKYLNNIDAVRVEVVSVAGENVVVNPDLGVPMLDIYTNKQLYSEKKPISQETMERVKTSSLRFTWEYPLPPYYTKPAEEQPLGGLVVIAGEPGLLLPENEENRISAFPVKKLFQQSSNIFKHQTFITVYHK